MSEWLRDEDLTLALLPVLLLLIAHDAQLSCEPCILRSMLPKVIQQQICVVRPQPAHCRSVDSATT